MRSALNKINRRFHRMRRGSVLILVVALLVLLSLIGTAFLSSSRNDRYATVQNTNNTQIDLLVEGMKNLAKATIVGGLYTNNGSVSLFKDANGTLSHNWTAADLYHQFSDDPNIASLANDAWLSTRTPSATAQATYVLGSKPDYSSTGISVPVWQCIGEPLIGNVFQSPFVIPVTWAADGTNKDGVPVGTESFSWHDRMTADFSPPASSSSANAPPWGKNITLSINNLIGSQLVPSYATIQAADGTTTNYPAFVINYFDANGLVTGSFKYLAGDADGDGVADCGMIKLPIGQLNGLTYYAGFRIVDNNSAVNTTTAVSQRYDFNGTFTRTRYFDTTSASTFNYQSGSPGPGTGGYNFGSNSLALGAFPGNVGLAELLHSYDGTGTTLLQTSGTSIVDPSTTAGYNGTIGREMAIWTLDRLSLSTSGAFGVVSTLPASGVPLAASNLNGQPTNENGALATDFAYASFADLINSQLGRRPDVPGYISPTLRATATSIGDAASLAYHFVFRNPNGSPTVLESALANSVYLDAPNGVSSGSFLPTRLLSPQFNPSALSNTSTAYSGTATSSLDVTSQWYLENFKWDNQVIDGKNTGSESCMSVSGSTAAAGTAMADLPRRSILTGLSTSSNIVQRPVGSLPPAIVTAGASAFANGMCKSNINTASTAELWKAFWLSMIVDDGTKQFSPMGDEAITGHCLLTGQTLYTGSQFDESHIADATVASTDEQLPQDFQAEIAAPFNQHPQRMFRSPLRIPANAAATNVYYPNGVYIPSVEMVKVRSAIAAVNATAMRDAGAGTFGSGEKIPVLDVPVSVTNLGNANVRVFGTTMQPYITEVYANTNVTQSQSPDATQGMKNSSPYVAIELYNPYPYDIDLSGWQLIAVDRTPTSDTNRGVTAASVIHTFTGADASYVVPGMPNMATAGQQPYQGGYMLIENFGSGGVIYRPSSSKLPPMTPLKVTRGYTPGSATVAPINKLNVLTGIPLEKAIGKELVLVRPLAATTSLGTGVPDAAGVDEVPIDSFDFTGLQPSTQEIGADVWHYVRANAIDTTNPTPSNQSNGLWRFIYPGRYDATNPTPYSTSAPSGTVPTVSGGPGANYSYAAFSRRQQGTEAGHFQPYPAANPPMGAGVDPFEGGGRGTTRFVGVTLGESADGTATSSDNVGGASYPVTFPFQYLNSDQPGPWPTRSATPPNGSPAAVTVNLSPFGAFARDSDILQVPFVGGYIVTTTTPALGSQWSASDYAALVEMNPITMDCSFAEDTDVTDDPPHINFTQASGGASILDTTVVGPWADNECVGRFGLVNQVTTVLGSEITDSDNSLVFTNASTTRDFCAPYMSQSVSGGNTLYWRYRWAGRVFDYLTTLAPSNDFQPNANPTNYAGTTTPTPVLNSLISQVAGDSQTAGYQQHAEDTVPVYGKINLNTASWRVLATLPFCPYDVADPRASQFVINTSTGAVTGQGTAGFATNVPDNVQLAQAIAAWRDQFGAAAPPQTYTTGHSGANAFQFSKNKGPFTSLADIFEVPAVRNYVNALAFKVNAPEPNLLYGHLSPNAAGNAAETVTDGVRNDLEERIDLLHRIGQQATVRSDTFTVYIVVQGWRNAESSNPSRLPQLVTQRRAAFFIDRSSVDPDNTEPKVYPIPQD